MKFLLDANFLLLPGKFKADIFSELAKFGRPELYTLDLIVKELEKIAAGKGRDAGYARLGLELIRKKRIRVLKTTGKSADLALEQTALKGNFTLCTQDRALIKKLRGRAPVIYLRQRKYLVKI